MKTGFIKMKASPWKTEDMQPATILWNLFLIAIGSCLSALAVNGVLIPQKFLSAGFTGVALGINYLFPSSSVAWLYFLLNVPLFALGWKFVGRRFFLYSLAGMVIYTCAIGWVDVSFKVEDKILASLLAGILMGAGSGIILRSLGSAGGVDILAVILLQRFSVSLGATSLAFNGIVLFGAAVLLSVEKALYTLVYIYVTSHILNLVVTGLSQRKAVFIVSSRWKDISSKITNDLHRGVTILHGEGGFTGREEKIIYTVVTFRELSKLKQMIRKLDPETFLVVTDTLEVMGRRIGNQPHW
jgi:uncharacterized membrane-anchored protein YitT (DUF2179 family)